MSSDINKMYQFINNYGIEKFMKDADGEGNGNGDGVIIKSEFENFLNSQGYSATKDVIDSFWKSVDTNDSEKRIEGTNLKNYRAVTNDEAERIEKVVKYYEELLTFCKTDLKAPTNLSSAQQTSWLTDMKKQLDEYYNAFVAGEIDEFNLTDKYEELVISITPRHAAEETMRELINGSELSGLKYDWEIDWNGQLGRKMTSHIKKYIKEHPDATPEDIVTEAHKVVNSMLDNAAITGDYNSTKVSLDEGFTQNSFTELQQVILDNILISHTDVQGLLAGETPTVIDKLFKRFYNVYFHQELKDFAEQQARVVEAFKLWFAEYGADVLAEIKAAEGIEQPEIPEPPQTEFRLGQTSYEIPNVEYGEEPQFLMSVIVYDQDGNPIDSSRITVRGDGLGAVEPQFNHDGSWTLDHFEVTSPITVSGTVGRIEVYVDEEFVGEIEVTASVSATTPPPSPPSPSYYEGTVYISAIVEDHRNADAQRQVSWSFHISKSDKIECGADLQSDLEIYAYSEYAIHFYGEDIVEILSLEYD